MSPGDAVPTVSSTVKGSGSARAPAVVTASSNGASGHAGRPGADDDGALEAATDALDGERRAGEHLVAPASGEVIAAFGLTAAMTNQPSSAPSWRSSRVRADDLLAAALAPEQHVDLATAGVALAELPGLAGTDHLIEEVGGGGDRVVVNTTSGGRPEGRLLEAAHRHGADVVVGAAVVVGRLGGRGRSSRLRSRRRPPVVVARRRAAATRPRRPPSARRAGTVTRRRRRG